MAGALGFVNAGLDEDEPVLVSAPGPGISFLRERMNGQAHRVDWADTAAEGANPARIMPVLRAFADAHAGRPVRFLQELAWAARTSAEQREAIRHEALINVAFAAAPVRVLCSYDSARLDPGHHQVGHEHPSCVRGGRDAPGPARLTTPAWYSPTNGTSPCAARLTGRRPWPTGQTWPRSGRSPPARPPASACPRTASSTWCSRSASLPPIPFCHTDAGGTLAIWAAGNELVCQVQDSGHITDPLAGRRRPAADAGGGHGLWLVHQVCDLVELRSAPGETVIRLHMRLNP